MTTAITQLTQSYWNQQPTFIPSFIETIDQFASSIFSLPVVQATDVGMIGYFEGECPEGWETYTKSDGRFIMSSSKANYTLGKKGGDYEHKITIEELPINIESNLKREEDVVSPFPVIHSQGPGRPIDYTVFRASSEKGLPYSNMPPYLSLNACRKIKEINLEKIKADTEFLKYEIQEFNGSLRKISEKTSEVLKESDKEKNDIKDTKKQINFLKKENNVLKESLKDLKSELDTLKNRKITIWEVIRDSIGF